jgi:hypothetical protein
MSLRALLALSVGALALQSCVALAIPAVAAGAIGKTQVDKARARTKAAETDFEAGSPIVKIGNAEPLARVPTTSAVELEGGKSARSALDRLDQESITNAYLPFASYAIGEAKRRQESGFARGVVLIEKASLLQPQTIDCGAKSMAAIIDLDVAPGTPPEMLVQRQNGFATLLALMRESDIRIIWFAETSDDALKPILDLLKDGDQPVIAEADLMMVGLPGRYRKQERRWQLASEYCIVAMAGDRKGDFDELYDYLRDPDYAIRLESFMGKGWFELPHPVAAIDSERLEISEEKDLVK